MISTAIQKNKNLVLSIERGFLLLDNWIFCSGITFILLLLYTHHSYSQIKCGTQLSNEQKEHLVNFYQNINRASKTSDTTTYYIPIKPHIIKRTNGTGGISYNEVIRAIDSTNYFYRNARIQFKICDTIGYLFDDNFTTLNTPDEEELLSSLTEEPRVINIYFADTLLLDDIRVCGFAYFPIGPNRIFIDNTCANSGNTLAHELGHFFALNHTHGIHVPITDELVNGSNCHIAGDFICDTPADPDLTDKVDYSQANNKCTYIGTVTDANGEEFMPMLNNIMSYSLSPCVDTFTQGQYDVMRESLFIHNRINLRCTPLNTEIQASTITSIFPVPFQNEFTIYYQLKRKAFVSLGLYDLMGKKLKEIYFNKEEAGLLKSFQTFSLGNLKSGIYLVKMEVNDDVVSSHKIVKINSLD